MKVSTLPVSSISVESEMEAVGEPQVKRARGCCGGGAGGSSGCGSGSSNNSVCTDKSDASGAGCKANSSGCSKSAASGCCGGSKSQGPCAAPSVSSPMIAAAPAPTSGGTCAGKSCCSKSTVSGGSCSGNKTASTPTTLITSPPIDEPKFKRLHVIDDIFEAFNNCDVEGMHQLLRSRCAPNMVFNLFPDGLGKCHFTGLHIPFIFWDIAHEIYPDAMLTILDRRFVAQTASSSVNATPSSTSSSPPHVIEIVYKFSGTGITRCSMFASFLKYMKNHSSTSTSQEESERGSADTASSSATQATSPTPSAGETTATKYDDLTLSIVRHITTCASVDCTTGSCDGEKLCSLILESQLVINAETALIDLWSVAILAGDDDRCISNTPAVVPAPATRS